VSQTAAPSGDFSLADVRPARLTRSPAPGGDAGGEPRSRCGGVLRLARGDELNPEPCTWEPESAP